MNQFNAAAINLSALIMPAASQLQPNIKNDSANNFIEFISNIISSEMTAEKAETAAFINSNPAVKTALYQAVAAMHLSNETTSAANSSPELLESNPVIRQAVSVNNLNSEEKKALIKAVIFTSEIITSKAAEIKSSVVPDQIQANKTAENRPASTSEAKNPVINSAPVSNSGAAVTAAGPVLRPVNATVINAAITPSKPAETIVTAGAAADQKTAITPGGVQPAVSNTEAMIPPAVIVSSFTGKTETSAAGSAASVTADAESVKMEILVNSLKEALKVFLDARLGLFSETDKEAVNFKEEITAKAETLNSQISQLKEIMTDETKKSEVSKLTAQIAAGIVSLFAAVDRAAYVLNDSSVTGVKPVSSNPSTGAGLNEIMSSIRRIEVAISNNPGEGSKNAYIKETENGIKEILARIFVLLKDMNGKAEVIRTTEYVNAPNASFTMRVTPEGKVIINTAESKYAPGQQAAAPDTQAFPVKAAVAAAQAPAEEQIYAQASASAKPAADSSVKNTQAVYPPQVQSAAATPQAAAPVVYAENDVYYNPETLAKNSSKELSQIFSAVSEALFTVKSKESIQVPADAKVFERAADAAGRVKENIVIRQVVQNIQNAVETVRTTEVKMFLRPENMGSVSIRLESTENTITGKIQAASAEVRDILKAALPELKITLNNMGINADRIEITLMNNSGQNSFDGRAFGDSYKEWEGGIIKVTNEEIDRADYAGLNGYLNFLA